MSTVRNWNGRLVPVRRSRGGVLTFERWEDNVLRRGPTPWPTEALLRQVRGYVARGSHFSAPDAQALGASLGRISKFQSINSEDAVTWSWFGTLGGVPASAHRRAVQWLYGRMGLDVAARYPVIDQWVTIPHPNAGAGRRGPELDARIVDQGSALVYVEAKWDAAIGTGKGKNADPDDQIVLRRDALRASAASRDDEVALVVLGVSEVVPDLDRWKEEDASLRPVAVRWLTWDDLAGCPFHPAGDEFLRYLAWKRAHALPVAPAGQA